MRGAIYGAGQARAARKGSRGQLAGCEQARRVVNGRAQTCAAVVVAFGKLFCAEHERAVKDAQRADQETTEAYQVGEQGRGARLLFRRTGG